MPSSDKPLRYWHEMSAREQLVWAASYAAHSRHGVDAAKDADQVANSLATVQWPEREEPEHRAARLCIGLTQEEFRGWYVVEHRILYRGKHRPPLSDADIAEAFKIYSMCCSDFY
jgi:hypothetical protein